MNTQVIIAGLKARPVRTTVSILAVTLEVVLILVIIGLTTGIAGETARRTAAVAEITVQPPNSSAFLALTSNTMPIALGDEIAKLPAVKAVSPIFVLVNTSQGVESIFGIDPQSFYAVSGGFFFHEGGLFKNVDEIIVDDVWAKSRHLTAGQRVELLNHEYKVAGIVEHGLGARVFMSLETARELSPQANRASLFYVKVKDPNQVQEAVSEINQRMPGYTVRDAKAWESLLSSSNIPGLSAFINAVVFISLCVGVLVIFLSMYTTITERTREIGILRSLGASKTFIIGLIFQESTFVCAIGVLFGIASSFAIARLLEGMFPTLIVQITFPWIVKAAVVAVISGLVGAFYPSVKAAAQDPVEALAYE
jgi:putative ABC transport system permease protein